MKSIGKGLLDRDTGRIDGGFNRVCVMLLVAVLAVGRGTVVVTDGHDDHCGSRSACQAIRDALIRKSAATGVAIVTVGLASATGDADHETLGLLAQGAPHGGAFWAENPNQLPSILGNVHLDSSDLEDSLQATFRIESPVSGAFSSGRTVMGHVRLEVCVWDCFHTQIPFVVPIP
jgi:hypothetical protein